METILKIIFWILLIFIGVKWMEASDKEKGRTYSNDEWKAMTSKQRREVHAARARMQSYGDTK